MSATTRTPTIIPIIPLPNGQRFSSNNMLVSGINQTSPKFNPNGQYNISSSSYANNYLQPFIPFNDNTDSPSASWSSDYKAADGTGKPYPKYIRDAYILSKNLPSSYHGGGEPGNYWITMVGGNELPGEWIQIQLPDKIMLYSYTLTTPRLDGGARYYKMNNFPMKYMLVGSNDGKTWDLIDAHIYKNDELPINNPPSREHFVNTSTKYSFFRIVFSEMYNRNAVEIHQFTLNGVEMVVANKETFVNLNRSLDLMSPCYESSDEYHLTTPSVQGEKNSEYDLTIYLLPTLMLSVLVVVCLTTYR
jgi:hypothetical protein